MNKTKSAIEYELVFWKEIKGNKFAKSLHPAMLSEVGFRTTRKAALIGTNKESGQFVTILYDRDYVINWLSTKLIKPINNYSLDKISELVKEAFLKSASLNNNQLLVDIDDDD